MPSDTQTFQQEGYEWGGDINFAVLVNRVADQFELSSTMPVTTSARLALITPALPHRMQVSQELLSGKINFHFLEESIRKVLVNAAAIAIERNQQIVDNKLIAASMKRYCPYLFWC
jgi:hypothetical protein